MHCNVLTQPDHTWSLFLPPCHTLSDVLRTVCQTCSYINMHVYTWMCEIFYSLSCSLSKGIAIMTLGFFCVLLGLCVFIQWKFPTFMSTQTTNGKPRVKGNALPESRRPHGIKMRVVWIQSIRHGPLAIKLSIKWSYKYEMKIREFTFNSNFLGKWTKILILCSILKTIGYFCWLKKWKPL